MTDHFAIAPLGALDLDRAAALHAESFAALGERAWTRQDIAELVASPGMWNFMLAARARGLGTAWTTVGLMMEQAIADVVGIPFAEVQQACLTPLAYTIGTDFKPALRPEPDTIIHWDSW